MASKLDILIAELKRRKVTRRVAACAAHMIPSDVAPHV
jgi:hypothetical protein